jgi:hypothetical protein
MSSSPTRMSWPPGASEAQHRPGRAEAVVQARRGDPARSPARGLSAWVRSYNVAAAHRDHVRRRWRGDARRHPSGLMVVGNPAKVVSDVKSVAQRHRRAATQSPVWPHEGWTIGRGIADSRRPAQREAVADGLSGYLAGTPPRVPRSRQGVG